MNTVAKSENGVWLIHLGEGVTFVDQLNDPSDQLKMKIASGSWLILLIAVWSGPDLQAVEVAAKIGKDLHCFLAVGIRPFERHSEIELWCPDLREKFGSPIWIFLEDGKKQFEIVGLRTAKEIHEMIEKVKTIRSQ